MKSKRIKFNGGGLYTKHGQRIAAQIVGGGVYMVDVDRGLHYFLPGCDLEKSDIMSAYRNNRIGNEYDVDFGGQTLGEARRELEELAKEETNSLHL